MKRILKFKIILLIMLVSSCADNFLDIKPSSDLLVPSKLKEFRGMLDNARIPGPYTYFGELSTTDFYLDDKDWHGLTDEQIKNAYIWNKDIYGATERNVQWDYPYHTIYYANNAYEGASKFEKSEERDAIIGSALFLRSWAHYMLVTCFAPHYNVNSAKKDLGIPLRLESDPNAPVYRNTVEEVYNQIIKDLIEASELLPKVEIYSTRPTKPAALALLARIYLNMGQYSEAKKYASLVLDIKNELLDYNTLDATLNYPFERFNQEVIFHHHYYTSIFGPSRLRVSDDLLNLYEEGDLRKNLFFYKNGNYITFKGSYHGNHEVFWGLGLDEVYLIYAESLVRTGQLHIANDILNGFLANRIEKSKFKPELINNELELLDKILDERRKQLFLRGLRWEDMKRLNLDARYARSYERIVDHKKYILPPNSNLYVFPIPPNVIMFGNIEQNIR